MTHPSTSCAANVLAPRATFSTPRDPVKENPRCTVRKSLTRLINSEMALERAQNPDSETDPAAAKGFEKQPVAERTNSTFVRDWRDFLTWVSRTPAFLQETHNQ